MPDEERQPRQVAKGSYIAQALGEGAKAVLNVFQGGTDEAREFRNRDNMLELVENTWVEGVLKKSLRNEVMIELGMETRQNAVEHPWDMILQLPEQPDHILPEGIKILNVFDQVDGALLILGEPGSGKTTMLLELGRQAIERAKQDKLQPIPVVLNLSSWNEKKKPFSNWLVEELKARYYISENIAQTLVKNDDLLLLLDGLDEVRSEYRLECAHVLNDFRSERGSTKMVVCSRVQDFEALQVALKLNGAIVLQPLSLHQVEEYFIMTGVKRNAIRKFLKNNEVLQELIKSPLMLSIFSLTYRDSPEKFIQTNGSFEEIRYSLFTSYIEKMFLRRGSYQSFPPSKSTYWLGWLGRKMLSHQYGFSIFEPENIQPTILEGNKQILIYVCSYALVIALLFGLAFGMLKGPTWGWITGLVSFLGFSTAGSMAGWSASKSYSWSWKNACKSLRSSLRFPILVGVGSAIIEWLRMKGIMGTQWKPFLLPGMNYQIRSDGQGQVVYFLWILVFTVLSSLVIIFITSGVTTHARDPKDPAHRGYWLHTGIQALIVFIISATSGYYFGGIKTCVVFGLLGLFLGAGDYIQYLQLRFMLFRRGFIPWNYRNFLNYATERIILRRVGRGYIFIHRMLMEHFAALRTE